LLDLASALLARSNVTLSHRQAFRNDREDCAFLPTYEVGEIVSGEVSTPLRLVELARNCLGLRDFTRLNQL